MRGSEPLTVRISTEASLTETTIRIDGRLTSSGVPDLMATCKSIGTRLRLDLSGLQSADRDGIRALQSLSEAGAELRNASPY